MLAPEILDELQNLAAFLKILFIYFLKIYFSMKFEVQGFLVPLFQISLGQLQTKSFFSWFFVLSFHEA